MTAATQHGDRRSWAVAVLLAVVIVPSSALAEQRRVVVLGLAGNNTTRIERTLRAMVKRSHHLVPRREYARTERTLGGPGSPPRQLRRLAREIRVDAVVGGEVTRRGLFWWLKLWVREGVSGAVISRFELRLETRRLEGRARQEVSRHLRRALREVEPLRAAVASVTPRPRAGADADAVPTPAVRDESPPSIAPADPPATVSPARRAPSAVSIVAPIQADRTLARNRDDLPRLDVDFGYAFHARRLRFNYDPAVTSQPWDYEGLPVSAIQANVELFPPPLPGSAGVYASYGQTIQMVSRPRTGTGGYDSVERRVGVGGTYRVRLGDERSSPLLRFQLGWDLLQFEIDTDGVPVDVPDVSYSSVSGGVGGRLPVGDTLAVRASARYLAVLSTGEMARTDQYGAGSVTGFDGEAGVEIRPLQATRWCMRIGVRYTRIGHDFDGTGSKANRDGDAGQDVGGALDEFLAANLTLSWSM